MMFPNVAQSVHFFTEDLTTRGITQASINKSVRNRCEISEIGDVALIKFSDEIA